jgi:VWFA-related protein
MNRTWVWAAVLGVILTHAPRPVPAQKPVFSARVDAVRVDMLVTAGGRPVTGLRSQDFELWDNGVKQRIDLLTVERLPLHVTLAFDTSGSVAGDRLAHLRSAAESVIQALRPDDSLRLLTFGSAVDLRLDGTDRGGMALALIDRVASSGDTALVDASYAAMVLSESDAETGRPLTIIFSDGADTASFLSADDVIAAARGLDSVVYAAGAGESGRSVFFRDLCEQTGGRVLAIESTQQLAAAMLDVLDEFRQRYVLTYSPAGVPGGGWHRLEVRVNRLGANVRARQGYFASG